MTPREAREDEYWRTVGFYEGEGLLPRRAEAAAERDIRQRKKERPKRIVRKK